MHPLLSYTKSERLRYGQSNQKLFPTVLFGSRAQNGKLPDVHSNELLGGLRNVVTVKTKGAYRSCRMSSILLLLLACTRWSQPYKHDPQLRLC